jgi:hypothetical protein
MRATALVILALAVVALASGGLGYVLPSSKRGNATSNSVEILHSKLRAAVVIIAACVLVASSIVAYLY